MTNKVIDWSKNNVFDAIGRPDLSEYLMDALDGESVCCGAPLYNGDICSDCKEHSGDRHSQEYRLDAIKDILFKYLDPKPEFSGIMAVDIAKKILDQLE